jgi:hypothetical protein
LNLAISEHSHFYSKGKFVYERQPTSTTNDKAVTLKTFGAGRNGAGTFLNFRVKTPKEIVSFSAVPSEQELLIPHNTLFLVEPALSYLESKDLEGFASFPPNVDIVILKEVCHHIALVTFSLIQCYMSRRMMPNTNPVFRPRTLRTSRSLPGLLSLLSAIMPQQQQ